jgi:cytochrome c556
MSHSTTCTRALIALLLAACTKAPIPATEQRPSDASMTALAALMKNQINPAFSKLMFLVFHGEELQEDPNAIRIEMQRFATVLRSGMGELAAWREPPTQTTEGREVFFTYSQNVDKQTQSLFDAIERRDGGAAEKQMQEIADTCNNCHHFFRLDIEDSVVPQSGTH